MLVLLDLFGMLLDFDRVFSFVAGCFGCSGLFGWDVVALRDIYASGCLRSKVSL